MAISEPFFTFVPVTALLFSCFVPTLFLAIFTAAYEVPPRATKIAR
jgi:hypothetical protein